MTPPKDSFDIDFLFINQLSYVFNKYSESPNAAEFTDQCIKIASQCLQLMDKYGALHPSFDSFISFLRSQNHPNPYDQRWAVKIQSSSDSHQANLNSLFKKIHTSSTASSAPSANKELYANVRKAVIMCIIERKYQDAIGHLNNYSAVVQFSTQPRDHTQLRDNRYIEYSFFQYVIGIFDLIWLPLDNSNFAPPERGFPYGTQRMAPVPTGNFKNLDAISRKVASYYTKSESLLTSTEEENSDHSELYYFWLMKFYGFTVLFKQFNFREFYDEFISLFIKYQSPNPQLELSPVALLAERVPVLKSDLLCMFGIVSIFVKPFNSLALMDIGNDDILLDLFNLDEKSFEYVLYNEVMVPLSEANNKKVKTSLVDNAILQDMFIASLDYLVPVINQKSQSAVSASLRFMRYLTLIIDLKNFLLIISVIKQAPRLKIIQLLGYDTNNLSEASISQISQILLSLVAALGLGEIGIGFNAQQDVFCNDIVDHNQGSKKLQKSLTDLTADVEAESLAALMTGALLEKFFS
ncbi:uncharacterized protein RJT20DRAFT_132683 [Scheffersomyces xylosifermentans]|uniref:uncharacterized protein n=1 Tax=Scheffersomyces xylosifermentans TaxID=1304137 RepID=UPI00315DC0ED